MIKNNEKKNSIFNMILGLIHNNENSIFKVIDWLIDWFTVMKILYLTYYWPFCAVFLFSLNPRIVVETKVGGERPAPKKKKLKLPEI